MKRLCVSGLKIDALTAKPFIFGVVNLAAKKTIEKRRGF